MRARSFAGRDGYATVTAPKAEIGTRARPAPSRTFAASARTLVARLGVVSGKLHCRVPHQIPVDEKVPAVRHPILNPNEWRHAWALKTSTLDRSRTARLNQLTSFCS